MSMPPKAKSTSDDLLDSLLDPRVIDALSKALAASISKLVEDSIEQKLSSIFNKFESMECAQKDTETSLKTLQDENSELRERLEELEAYSRGDNLIIHGIETSSYSDAVSSANAGGGLIGQTRGRPSHQGSASSPVLGETSAATESIVIQFVNDVLNIPLSSADISVAHRLPKRPNDKKPGQPAPIIVRFSSRQFMRNYLQRAYVA